MNSPGWTFFRQWLRDPLRVAAISPSGPRLVQAMVAGVGGPQAKVVEFGAGTGVFTQALLERGVAPEHLLVIELNAHLAEFLQRRFPQVRVVCADARQARELISACGYARAGEVDAVVSGLGLLSMPAALREQIVAVAATLLTPAGLMRQYTYGPRFPVPPERLALLGLSVTRVADVWLNLPPASVYELRRLTHR